MYASDPSATPSLLDGVDWKTECNLRVYFCEIIGQAGVKLSLPQVTISTAQTLLHRFYFVKSLAKYDVKDMILGALYVATKLEESHTDPRSILNVVNHIYQVREKLPEQPLNIFESYYVDQKETMYAGERKLLKSLGFKVFVDHPHRYILAFLKILGSHENTELVQKCWNYLNDSQKTTACCQFPPHVIACTAIYLAARALKKALPEKWYTLFDSSLADIEKCGLEIMKLYERPPSRYIELRPKKK